MISILTVSTLLSLAMCFQVQHARDNQSISWNEIAINSLKKGNFNNQMFNRSKRLYGGGGRGDDDDYDDDDDEMDYMIDSVSSIGDTDDFSEFDKFDQFDALFERFEKKFQNFQVKYNKVYATPQEKRVRLKLYAKNVMSIERHNKKYQSGRYLFTLVENEFTDLEYKEFIAKYTGLATKIRSKNKSLLNKKKPSTNKFTEKSLRSVDWRTQNLVSPVLHQKECGSCWTFASSGVIEGQLAKTQGSLVQLSKQQLLDCVDNDPNICNKGGTDEMAYNYLFQNGCLPDRTYPYRGYKTQCFFRKSQVVARPKREMHVLTNEKDMERAIAKVGPIYAVLHASIRFMYYRAGIFNDPDCKLPVNHAILIIGYGQSNDGIKYWIIKNSYGVTWGEAGFMRLQRGVNMCRIGEYGSYVLL